MLTDNFKRKIDYLRISVTDRCDLRCTYCMAEDVTFLPRQEVLSIEEIIKLTNIFNELGVKKFRLTEIPIIFKDRVYGDSKMNGSIIFEAVFGLISMKMKSLLKD